MLTTFLKFIKFWRNVVKLWRVLPDEQLPVIPQKATEKQLVDKGSCTHMCSRRHGRMPSIHPLDSEGGLYVGLITVSTEKMAKVAGNAP